MNVFKEVPCRSLDIEQFDSEGCNSVLDCTWHNTTEFLGIQLTPAGCYGYVNKTFYNIVNDSNSKSTYCSANGLQTIELCESFRCNWLNNTNQFTESRTINDKYSTATIWEVVAWTTTFNIDIGWGSYNWIISIIFYILMLLLLMSLYFMFVPF